MERICFEGWSNCLRLFNSEIELVITTDVGPRIIQCGFKNKQNLFHISDVEKGKTGGNQWHIYGGHRLWHSPEAAPRSYFPDNSSVEYNWNGKTLRLRQNTETTTGIQKEMDITLDSEINHVKIVHRLINNNLWAIETSPWAITAHAAGSTAILPQEPYIDPAEDLLPARPVVLWNYTHMNDKRWTWGNKYILLKHDPSILSEQKIGILNKQGWSACLLDDTIMIKRFGFDHAAVYPDYGSNNEVYVNESLLEVETLGPLSKIHPSESVEHIEEWYFVTLDNRPDVETDSAVDNHILPFISAFIR